MSTKTIALAGAFAAATIASTAVAGNYEPPAPDPAPVAPVVDWSGNYWGFVLGYGSGDYRLKSASGDGVNVNVDGAIFGMRYARNMQNGNRVYGFDAELSSGPDGITPQGTTGPYWSCNTGDCNVSIEALLTLRGRYGGLLNADTLAYGAAGLAAASVNGGIRNSPQQGSSNEVGFTVGVGVERRLQSGWNVFGEINYVDLGDLRFGTGSGTEPFKGAGDFSTLKVGFMRRF
jgi:outer membrane immunogenic protein